MIFISVTLLSFLLVHVFAVHTHCLGFVIQFNIFRHCSMKWFNYFKVSYNEHAPFFPIFTVMSLPSLRHRSTRKSINFWWSGPTQSSWYYPIMSCSNDDDPPMENWFGKTATQSKTVVRHCFGLMKQKLFWRAEGNVSWDDRICGNKDVHISVQVLYLISYLSSLPFLLLIPLPDEKAEHSHDWPQLVSISLIQINSVALSWLKWKLH